MSIPTSQPSLWQKIKTARPRKHEKAADPVLPTPALPKERHLRPGEMPVTVTLILLHDEQKTPYQCIGTMWFGNEQKLLLVRADEIGKAQAARHVVQRDNVLVMIESEAPHV